MSRIPESLLATRDRSLQIHRRDDVTDDARTMRWIISTWLPPSEVYKAVDLFHSVAVYCNMTPEPVNWSLVFAREKRWPSVEDELLKPGKYSAASGTDETNDVVSIDEVSQLVAPTSTLGFLDMWSKIQSIAIEKRAGARIQPCLTPDVVRNRLNRFLPLRTWAPVFWCSATVSSRKMSETLLLRSGFR